MLDEGDKAIIRSIAFEAAEHSEGRIKTHVETMILLHRQSCPVAQEFHEVKAQARGGWRVLAAVGGLLSGVAALLVTWFKH